MSPAPAPQRSPLRGPLGRALLLARSVRHTRPHQLGQRVLLTLRRTLRDARLRVSARASSAAPPLRMRAGLPAPVFPTRTGMLRSEPEGITIRVLSEWRPLRFPLDWHPPEFERGTLLDKMVLHYTEFLEEADDATFVATLEDWIAANPWNRPGAWRDAWNSYAIAVRSVLWMQEYARRQERLPAPQGELLARSLSEQLRYLRRNLELDLGGNHLVKDLKALLWAGAFFEGAEAEGYAALGRRLLEREIAEQVLADGVHFERSPAYHAQVFADLLECRHVLGAGERVGLDPVLERMAQALADLTHPDGEVSLFNDGALDLAYPSTLLLDSHARATGKRVLPRPLFALEEAGYYGARDSDSLVLLDCGAIGPDYLPAHGHGDMLAFEWTLGGVRLIVDAGVYEYHPGPWRDWARSTRAHNTLTLDDADQCEFWGAFRVGRRVAPRRHSYAPEGDGFVLEGAHDGFAGMAGAPRHVRRAHVRPRRIEIEDRVQGGAGQEACARLLLHPDCRLESGEEGWSLAVGPVRARLATNRPVRVARAFWSPTFGVARATAQIEILYGPAPCSGRFVLEEVG